MFNLAFMKFLRKYRKQLIGTSIALVVAVLGVVLDKCA